MIALNRAITKVLEKVQFSAWLSTKQVFKIRFWNILEYKMMAIMLNRGYKAPINLYVKNSM